MSRQSWLIEHVLHGAYLGQGLHPRSGKTVPLFRAQDRSRPALLFASPQAACAAVSAIGADFALFRLIVLHA